MNTSLPALFRRTLILALCLGSCSLLANPVEIGDTEQEVQRKLGQPQGKAQTGELNVWMYPRGEIDFSDGAVEKVQWMTDEEFKAHKEGVRLQAKRRKQAEEATAKARAAEAEARRKEILSDPAYTNLPPAEQVAIWDEYYRTYPKALPADEQTAAREALEEEKQKKADAEAAALTPTNPPPRLSGSKSRKAKRGAGEVKPEDRPSFMTRRTLPVNDSDVADSFLSDKRIPADTDRDTSSFLGEKKLNIKESDGSYRSNP